MAIFFWSVTPGSVSFCCKRPFSRLSSAPANFPLGIHPPFLAFCLGVPSHFEEQGFGSLSVFDFFCGALLIDFPLPFGDTAYLPLEFPTGPFLRRPAFFESDVVTGESPFFSFFRTPKEQTLSPPHQPLEP